jgi:hypothetical protein
MDQRSRQAQAPNASRSSPTREATEHQTQLSQEGDGPSKRSMARRDVGVAAGGTAVAIGSLVSWVKGDSFLGLASVNGIATNEGRIALILGLAIVLLALGQRLIRHPARIWLTAAMSVVVLATVAFAALTLEQRWVKETAWNSAYPDFGMYIVFLGALVAVISAVASRRMSRV